MHQIERLESLDDARLDVFRSLKSSNTVRDSRLFVAEGPTVVERVLRSGFVVRSLLISDRKWESFSPLLPPNVPVFRLRQDLAEELVGFSFHCGLLASVERRPAADPLDWARHSGAAVILAGERIVDPENVGALIRIASAFGAAGVLFGPGSADPFSRRVLRVSMGNGLFLPVAESRNLDHTLRQLSAEAGFQICHAVLEAQAVPVARYAFPERVVLVLGNEYDGLSAECRQVSGVSLQIPMWNQTDSLNVAVSAAVLLHEYRRHWNGD